MGIGLLGLEREAAERREREVKVAKTNAFDISDDRSTMRHIPAFVNTLRGHKMYRSPLPKGSDRVLKILFTTAGRSRTLLTDLEEDELVFAERAGSAVKPGRTSAGRRPLSPTPLKALKHDASL